MSAIAGRCERKAGFSYNVCSAMSPNFTIFGLFILVFEISAIIQKQLVAMLQGHMRFVCRNCIEIVKTDYGCEMVIPLYIAGCRKKTCFESAIVVKWHRLIHAIYSLNTASDIKRYHHLRTVISLVSGFFLMLCACWEANEIWWLTYRVSYSHSISNSQSTI